MTPLDLPAGESTGAGRDQNPAAERPPVARRGARTTQVPGSAGAGTSQPPRCEVPAQTSPQLSERQAAGKPIPVTGADGLPSSAPGRGRAKSPAGGAINADDALPAGSRLLAAAMSEAEFEIHVRALVKDLGLLWYHTHDSRHSPSGFPDLVIVGRGVIYRELKTAKGKVSDAQAEWLHALVMAEQDACVWRPADLVSGLIGRRLAALAGLRAATA